MRVLRLHFEGVSCCVENTQSARHLLDIASRRASFTKFLRSVFVYDISLLKEDQARKERPTQTPQRIYEASWIFLMQHNDLEGRLSSRIHT